MDSVVLGIYRDVACGTETFKQNKNKKYQHALLPSLDLQPSCAYLKIQPHNYRETIKLCLGHQTRHEELC